MRIDRAQILEWVSNPDLSPEFVTVMIEEWGKRRFQEGWERGLEAGRLQGKGDMAGKLHRHEQEAFRRGYARAQAEAGIFAEPEENKDNPIASDPAQPEK